MGSVTSLRSIVAVGLILILAACGKVEGGDVDADVDPPDDAMADALDAPPVTDCIANTFVDCENGNARICNATGDGVDVQSCGGNGCNATARRCNMCQPGLSTCDGMVLESCDAEGLPLADQTCQLACNATPTAHCAYISPTYLPNICDAAAVMPSLAISASATIDTALDTNCTGTVIPQTGGPPICVLRYGTIGVMAGRTLTLTGTRVAALVSDGDLVIAGTIDASATGLAHGPGGGGLTSGGLGGSTSGGGGAGYGTNGAAGANQSTAGGAANGGALFDPLNGTVMVGGARGARPGIGGNAANGGGAGGALMLISCRGNVIVSGTLDLGGGGGGPGFDFSLGGQLQLVGAAGGGTGGYGVLQGVGVQVTGQVFANGGGGGGGGANDTSGIVGGDGPRSASSASGGSGAVVGTSTGGAGGIGGRQGGGPGVGNPPVSQGSPGGGGGAMGRFQSYTPSGVSPTLTPSSSSPNFQPNRNVTTR